MEILVGGGGQTRLYRFFSDNEVVDTYNRDVLFNIKYGFLRHIHYLIDIIAMLCGAGMKVNVTK